MASFEPWAGVLSGILSSAGIPGFLSNVDAYMTTANEDSGALREVVQLWFARQGFKSADVADLLGCLTGPMGELLVDLPDVKKAHDSHKVDELRKVIKEQMLGGTFEVEGPAGDPGVRKTGCAPAL